MKKILALSGSLIVYFCLATVLTLCLLVGYLAMTGKINKEKYFQMVAVAQGVDLSKKPSGNLAEMEKERPSQVSLEDVAAARAKKLRDIEFRENIIRNELERSRFERSKLSDENERSTRLKTSFMDDIKKLREGNLAVNRQNVLQILENLAPDKAKAQILTMVENEQMDEVVLILSAMSTSKRGKILNEFNSEEEKQKLADILREIREGIPDSDIIDQAEKELNTPPVGDP